MPSYHLSEDAKFTILETADIGGTNTGSTGNFATWLEMDEFERVTAVIEIGTWNATDDLDTCKLQQYDGTTTKDLTTSASGGDYDTDTPVDADGDQVILEARADQLDTANGFNRVRVYCAEGGNTGVDNVSGVIIRWGSKFKHKNRHRTASTGSVVYVTPD